MHTVCPSFALRCYANVVIPLKPQSEAEPIRSGRSAAWLARLVRDQEVEGSNPFAPTISFRTSNLRTDL